MAGKLELYLPSDSVDSIDTVIKLEMERPLAAMNTIAVPDSE